jgi:hypothetical protein
LLNQQPENLVEQEKDPSTILRIVPAEQGFHFMTEHEAYIGLTAVSLEDFATKIKTVDIESVVYHYYRGDFQRWIDGVLGDRDFANKLCFVATNISGEKLREELSKLLDKRISDLKGLSWIETEGI